MKKESEKWLNNIPHSSSCTHKKCFYCDYLILNIVGFSFVYYCSKHNHETNENSICDSFKISEHRQ